MQRTAYLNAIYKEKQEQSDTYGLFNDQGMLTTREKGLFNCLFDIHHGKENSKEKI